MYANGQGVPQDFTDAAQWFRKAAERGDVVAQEKLGFAYLLGEGVPQDYLEAHKWLNLAAARASGDNQKASADFRDRIAKMITPDQLAEAQKRAREWMEAFEDRRIIVK